MKIAFVTAFLLFSSLALAQPGPDTLWTKFYGWTGDDTAFCIKKTADNGFIIAGTATVPADGHTNGFLIKADSNGVMQGFHSYGGPHDDGLYSVALTYDGGYALAGYTSNATGYRRNYYIRANAFGDTLCTYSDSTADPYQIWCTSVASLQDNSLISAVVVAWSTQPGYAMAFEQFGSLDCQVALEWDHYRDNIRMHAAHACGTLGAGVVGQCSDTITSPKQAFLWNFSAPHPFIRTYGGNGYDDDAYDFVETPSGFFLAGASDDGQVDGIFLCKTDTVGEPIWTHRLMTQQSRWVEAALPALGGGYVIAGTSDTYNNGTDMFLAKVNEAGDIVWERTYGTADDERAYDVVQTDDGSFVLCGYSNAHLGVGTEWYLVKTLPDPTLAAHDPVILHPSSFILAAFPNPFNPATTISFALPRAGKTKLVVYDIAGREVRTLSDQMFEAGEHRVTFDGSALPSGIYFARTASGEFVATQKLLLLK